MAGSGPEARIPRAAVALLAAILGLLAACSSCGEGARKRPSIVLVSIDTARADRFGMYGCARNTTPRLDSLGRSSFVFDQAVTVSENTLISHASLLTGLFPGAHGATFAEGGVPIRETYPTLAEDLLRAGYRTAGFTAHGDWLNEKFGFRQGFEVFSSAYRDADAVLAEAEAWLSSLPPDDVFFLFVHLFDPHSDFRGGRPYEAPAPFAGLFTKEYAGELADWEMQPFQGSDFLRAVMDGSVRVTDEDLRYIEGQYDEGLRYTDDRLGRFLHACIARADPFIVVTADHGEEFLEHGTMLHSSLYDPVVRVPLILRAPESLRRRWPAPRRIAEQVRIVDLRPTLCSIAGLPAPDGCQGIDLLLWLMEPTEECPSGPAPLYYGAVRHDGFKLMHAAGGLRLFDLRGDPGETVNVAGEASMSVRIREMIGYLDRQRERDDAMRAAYAAPGPGHATVPPDSEVISRLRSLGYAP